MGKVHISMGTTGGSRYILILGSWKFQIVMDYHGLSWFHRTRLVEFISSFIDDFFCEFSMAMLPGKPISPWDHPMKSDRKPLQNSLQIASKHTKSYGSHGSFSSRIYLWKWGFSIISYVTNDQREINGNIYGTTIFRTGLY